MDQEPAPAPAAVSRRSPRVVATVVAVVATITLAAIAAILAVLWQEPAFYREARATDRPALEPLARRLVSKASSLHAAIGRPGDWEAAVAESEVNAWLTTDLPRNHRGLLPPRVSEPRVAFLPHRPQAAARLGLGPISAVAWADVEVWLQGVNQVGMRLSRAGLGGIPLPRDAVLRQLSLGLSRAGLVTDLRRIDGRDVLVVSPPANYDADAASWRLETLAFGAGELLVAGTTGRAAKGASRE